MIHEHSTKEVLLGVTITSSPTMEVLKIFYFSTRNTIRTAKYPKKKHQTSQCPINIFISQYPGSFEGYFFNQLLSYCHFPFFQNNCLLKYSDTIRQCCSAHNKLENYYFKGFAGYFTNLRGNKTICHTIDLFISMFYITSITFHFNIPSCSFIWSSSTWENSSRLIHTSMVCVASNIKLVRVHDSL